MIGSYVLMSLSVMALGATAWRQWCLPTATQTFAVFNLAVGVLWAGDVLGGVQAFDTGSKVLWLGQVVTLVLVESLKEVQRSTPAIESTNDATLTRSGDRSDTG